MARPIVFMLHGMGTHEPGWADGAFGILDKRATSFRDSWKIVTHELEYDSKFRDLLAAWARNSKQIVSDAQPANKEPLKQVVGWLNDADKDTFAWTAAADVFLWRTSSTIRKLVVNHVANQVAPVIARAPAGQARNVHFVAHSLGTAVLHELLSALATSAWTPEGDATVDGLAPTRWRPMAIHTIANVSRALELSRNPVYASPVKPGPTGDPVSYCQKFRNYGHALDPFAHIAPFEPPWATDPRYESFRPLRVKDPKKVHALESYLELPVVNVPMIESMFDPLPPDSDALDDVPSGYKMPTKAIEDRLKAEIEKFGQDSSLFQTVRSIYNYFRGL